MLMQARAQGQISGRVSDDSGPLPFVNIGVPSTHMGAITDGDGRFYIEKVPAGTYTIEASFVGYQQYRTQLVVQDDKPAWLHIVLKPSLAELEEVVVTGTRTERKQTESPVMVDVLHAKTLEDNQAFSLADGLGLQPGLRLETDCQTCGYSQLRMNGLSGAYTQILINSRPIFTSLIGLYGLEMLPPNMIDKVEIVRGGGSALYGSSAIGGTVNIITKMPEEDAVSAGYQGALIGGQSTDHLLSANASKRLDAGGFALFAARRNRQAYDHNGDGFSELPSLNSTSFGTQLWLQTDQVSTLSAQFNGLVEERLGGNKLDGPPHLADQSEMRRHNIVMAGIDYERSLKAINSSLSIYTAAQRTGRDHYTGIDGADAYGQTSNYTVMGGLQYNHHTQWHVLTAGAEYSHDYIFDEIPLYQYLIDQRVAQVGAFVQSDWQIARSLSLVTGLRADRHNLVDGALLNPRANLLYQPGRFTQLRASAATGYRAPQAFDTDLHIAFAGGGISRVVLDPALKEERSRSYTLSYNYDRPSEHAIYGFTAGLFHTRLIDAFVLEDQGTDDAGNTILQKKNGGGSVVQGLSLEGRFNLDYVWEMDVGFTLQHSAYGQPVQWSNTLEPSANYLRTPDRYGYYTLRFRPFSSLTLTGSGVYTGSMKLLHMAGAPGVPHDRYHHSQPFFDQSLNLSYDVALKNTGLILECAAGVHNVFNAYQDDFDIGKNRDSNYVYGPAKPRTWVFSLRLKNGA
jgi:outer membrane receptor for ferrienterochelin and colicins